MSLFHCNTFFVCVMNKGKFFGDDFFCNIFSWVVWNIHINKWSLLNRVTQELRCPRNWVPWVKKWECPTFCSSAPMPKYLSSQVPKCPSCRSIQVPFECSSASSAWVHNSPSPLSAHVARGPEYFECPSVFGINQWVNVLDHFCLIK